MVGRDAAHVVVAGGQHRHRLLGDVDAGEDARGLGDPRQTLGDERRRQVLDMELYIVAVRPASPALAHLDGRGAADNVARGQVLGRGGVTLHEALALGIGEIAPLSAHALGDQAAGAIDAGGVELDELHVLERQPGPQDHAIAVPRAGMGGRTGEIGAAVTAGSEYRHLAPEPVHGAVAQAPGEHPEALSLVVHQEVGREIFDEELRVMPEGLLIERVQDGVAGAVGRRAGALRRAFAEVRAHAPECALIDLALGRAREGHAKMLELDHRGHGLAHHVFDGILIAEPVRALDRVVHMPAPVVLAHVAERGADAALGRDRVAARREDLGQARRLKALLRHAEGRAQAGTARAHDDDVVFVVDDLVGTAHIDLNRRRRVSGPRTACRTRARWRPSSRAR